MSSGILSSTDILNEIKNGNVIIKPFEERNLSNCSYDITLGENYFSNHASSYEGWMNPFRKGDTDQYWGLPKVADQVSSDYEAEKTGLPIGSQYILLNPRKSILGHTNEFIGGRNHITTVLHARSTIGRSEITICDCAGMGDIGYVNRWTLEIRNQSDVNIVLPVGIRIGQIVFFYSSKPFKEYQGKYQRMCDLATLMKHWKPEQMLPQGWKDPEGIGNQESRDEKPIEESWNDILGDRQINYVV